MKPSQVRRLLIGAGVAVAVLGSTVGCTVAAPTATVTPTPAAAASSAAPTPSATPTATPTPTPTPFAVSCDSIVSPATRSGIGAPLIPPANFFTKNASGPTPNEFSVMRDNGGTVCAFGKLEVMQVYGYSRLNPGQNSDVGAYILAGDPYTTSSYLGGTLYTSGMDGNPFTFYLVTSKEIYLASTMPVLNDMLSTIPAF